MRVPAKSRKLYNATLIHSERNYNPIIDPYIINQIYEEKPRTLFIPSNLKLTLGNSEQIGKVVFQIY